MFTRNSITNATTRDLRHNNTDADDKIDDISALKEAIHLSDYIVIGAGSGFSSAAGHSYSGERFINNFYDFHEKYKFDDMYSGSFYPFETEEEYFAFWSRFIYLNRYADQKSGLYKKLLKILKGKEFFVITSNVDNMFIDNGFPADRFCRTQGDYGLYECHNCNIVIDNKKSVLAMNKQQKNMLVPSRLIPKCPKCGGKVVVNVRINDDFVEDDIFIDGNYNYASFLSTAKRSSVLFLELGVGFNTPSIIKYPFWFMTRDFLSATYCIVNDTDISFPFDIRDKSIRIKSNINTVIDNL